MPTASPASPGDCRQRVAELGGSGADTAASTASPKPARRTAWLLLAVVVLLWGLNWPVIKVGLGYIAPLTFVASRMLLGAVTMFAVAAGAGQLGWPSRHDWPVVIGIGLLQVGGFLTLTTLGLQYVPAGRSAILAYTTSLWVVPMAVVFLGERLSGLRLVGFILGLCGVLTLFNPFGFDWSDPDVLIGNALLLLAALLWAILIVQVRGHRMEGSPLSIGPWQFIVGACLVVPLAVLTESDEPIHWSWELVVVLAYNGPIATAFGFWAMISVTRALPAVTTSLSSLGVPAWGLMVSVAFFGERLTWTNAVGLALIVSGVACVSLGERHRSGEAQPCRG